MIKRYFSLTKPGIIGGNAVTAAAGFFLASRGDFDAWLFIAMLAGLSLVIAAACVFNNYFDREIDKKMTRTKDRALAAGSVSPRGALVFATILLILGLVALYYHTNRLALFVAIIGFLVYVFLYTPLKRRTVYGTLIGSIAGATPPVVGYTAVTGNFDGAAVLLFAILALWQMPHFYSIAIYRLNDYADASIPVLPVARGVHHAKKHILFYVVAFTAAALLLWLFGYVGYAYLVAVLVLGGLWLFYVKKGFEAEDNTRWARKMFTFSLVVLTLLSILMAVDAL